MSVVVYPAILDDRDNGKKGYYTVTFPDVPGAISEGNGKGEAMINGAEALGGVLLDTPTDELPVASSIEEIKKKNPDVLVVEIASDLDEARRNTRPVTVKKNTTIPGDLAFKAEQAGINFSQTLTEALKSKLGV
ncbi:type II toxin-antitoxin system HicB family antitoxin [Lactobacillus mulieris]|uniref:type II toxin-antitoxin system HicB family antitoxin n=1 Tax=Lactobacillus TaxID=1578 RepID=UPI001F2AFB0C|nr:MULTISPECIES: type II toxin-antitoxin system HicB family antitoxin [Lactobacillus]MCF1843847.1 type II toxin-antitoxin system HicB family antitoxin [Lactobacillus jensenii]MCW8105476.1 type II toxin-antitoxin system HicB family antitoxin [Lactobacillus mulieris]MDK7348104.1 type II toxin-antitoxin system HicB family antitoxin [Lactobacillus mulieris]